MRSSLLNTAVSFVLVIIAIANMRRHQMVAGQLLRERARLENIQLVADEQAERFYETLVKSITSDLKLRVDQMSGKSAQEVLALLNELINKVVQPLSRELSSQSQQWIPDFVGTPKVKVQWLALLTRSFNPMRVNYVAIPLLLTLIVSPTILVNSSPSEAVTGLGLTNAVAISLGYLFRQIYRKRRGWMVEYFAVVSLTAISMGIASTYLTRDYDSKFSLLLPGSIFYIISATLLSLISGAEEQRKNGESELKLTVDRLQWNVSRVRERQRQNYRKLSRNLHDQVQAQLSSKYLELDKYLTRGNLPDDFLPKMVDTFSALIDGLANREVTIEPIEVVVERIRENWVNIATISLESDLAILKVIEEDSLCSTSIIDVIPELVFNGIKHGKATEIEMFLEFIEDQKIRLSVIDNGSFEKVESAIGLGTSILNESCISWTRERRAARTFTITDFAFCPSSQLHV
jgi:signal transduction histidine kinase